MAIIGLLVLIVGLLLYPHLFGGTQQGPTSTGAQHWAVPIDTATARLGPKSVAVLPFTYLTTADSTDYFSMGMAAWAWRANCSCGSVRLKPYQ